MMNVGHRHPNIIGNLEDYKQEEEDGPDTLGITAAEINAKAPNVAQMYRLCTQARFFMPSQTSSVCSRQFLADVLSGTCYMPRNEDVRQKTVFGNPSTVSSLLSGHLYSLCAGGTPPVPD